MERDINAIFYSNVFLTLSSSLPYQRPSASRQTKMTGGTFILPPSSSSDEDDSDRDWSAGDNEDDDLSTEEEQAIHVGPSSYSSRDEIAMTELGEAPLPLQENGNGGIGIRRGKRGGAGGRERRVEWVGKPHVVGPEWMKMPL
jgi:hypothetical protein